MKITIRIDRVVRMLLGLVAGLFAANAVIYIVREIAGYDYLLGLFPLLDFYEEGNLPTWFSTLLLAASAALLYTVFSLRRTQSDRYYWLVLAGVFLYLSVDEFAQLHELIGSFLDQTEIRSLLPNETHTWVILGGVGSLVVGAAFLRFWLRLERRARLIFLSAAVVYVGGALGFEIIEIFYLPKFGADLGFYALVAVEEAMEMLGVIILIRGLLEQVAARSSFYQISIATSREDAAVLDLVADAQTHSTRTPIAAPGVVMLP